MALPPLLFTLLIGWVTGWLVNYLSDVLPKMRRLTRPLCVRCGRRRTAPEQLLAQPCARCGYRNPLRFWLVQTLCLIGAPAVWAFPPPELPWLLAWFGLSYLLVVAIIDLETRYILNPVALVGVLVGAAVGIWRVGWARSVLGGVSGFLVLLLLYGFGILYLRWKARKGGVSADDVALGFGDVNLAGVLGLMIGLPYNLSALVLAILLAGGVSLIMVIVQLIQRRYDPAGSIPYGPFLVLGAAVYLYYFPG